MIKKYRQPFVCYPSVQKILKFIQPIINLYLILIYNNWSCLCKKNKDVLTDVYKIQSLQYNSWY